MTDGLTRFACPAGDNETTADWRYMMCPLPVLRGSYNDADEWVTRSEPCGADLMYEVDAGGVLLAHGPEGDEPAVWKIGCQNGHVLVVPDDEGNEHYDLLPCKWSMVKPLLDQLGVEYRNV